MAPDDLTPYLENKQNTKVLQQLHTREQNNRMAWLFDQTDHRKIEQSSITTHKKQAKQKHNHATQS